MTNGDIMRLYDSTIAKGGSADFVLLYTVRSAIAKDRKMIAEIVRNRRFAVNWNDREALYNTILELPNSLNGFDFRSINPKEKTE